MEKLEVAHADAVAGRSMAASADLADEGLDVAWVGGSSPLGSDNAEASCAASPNSILEGVERCARGNCWAKRLCTLVMCRLKPRWVEKALSHLPQRNGSG